MSIKSCLPLGSKSSDNTVRLNNKDGIPTATYTESREVVQNYFTFVFDGESSPLAEVIDRNRSASIFYIRRGKTWFFRTTSRPLVS